MLNQVAKRVAKIPGPIGDIAKGVDDVIDDSQFVENDEPANKAKKSDDNPPAGGANQKKWFQKVPVWAWIVGGVVVVAGVITMLRKKKHKGGRYA